MPSFDEQPQLGRTDSPALRGAPNTVNSAAMRLTQIALGLTLVLLAVTGYLAWQSHQESRGVREELELIKRQQQAQMQMQAGAAPAAPPSSGLIRPPRPGEVAAPAVAPPPPPSVVPAASVPKNAASGARVPAVAATLTPPALGQAALSPVAPTLAVPAPAPLTPVQQQIMSMPTIAKVKQYEKDAGFVVISAGKSQRIAPGTKFDLRRDNAVVGRITIGETIEAEESVGDLDPASVPAGVAVQAGDEVIQVVNNP